MTTRTPRRPGRRAKYTIWSSIDTAPSIVLLIENGHLDVVKLRRIGDRFDANDLSFRDGEPEQRHQPSQRRDDERRLAGHDGHVRGFCGSAGGAFCYRRKSSKTRLAAQRDSSPIRAKDDIRIEDGTYGICESCGEPIGKMRLMAFPRATLCMTCKQREERR